jgi:hypothetical protein
MSHSDLYHQLLNSAHADGYLLSPGSGCLIHCALGNIDAHNARHVDGDHDAHVLAWLEKMLGTLVNAMFRTDMAVVCTPPAEKVAAADLPVPVVGSSKSGECSLQDCPPDGVNETAPTVTAVPSVSGPQAGALRLSNLDVHGKLVKRGRKVSYGGLRALVTRVNRGRCVVGYLDINERFTGRSEWLICERVAVVS